MKFDFTATYFWRALVGMIFGLSFVISACKTRSFGNENHSNVRSGPVTPGLEQNVGFPYGDAKKDAAASRHFAKPAEEEID